MKKIKQITIEVLKWILFILFIYSISILASPLFPWLLLSKKACGYMERILDWYVGLGFMPKMP